MRKTIFRGLNKKGKWVYGDLVNCEGIKHMPKQNTKTWIVTSAFGNGGWFNIRHREYVLPDTVGQFSGVKDKDGVGMFEGDKVHFEHDGIDYFFVVSFSESGCFIAHSECDVGDCYFLDDLDYTVIGNIHQNKELAEV